MPGLNVGKAEIIEAGEGLSEALAIDVGTRVLKIIKIFTADETPVIHITSFLPEWILGDLFDNVYQDPSLTEPLFEFFPEKCDQQLKNMHTEFWPDTLGGSGISLPKINPETPVLIMNHIAYNETENPIYLSKQIQLGNRMRYSVIRTMENAT